MMTKEDLCAELGDYINRFHKRRAHMGLEGALVELGQDLEDLFDGKDAPTVFIYVVERLPDGRFLLKVDSLGATTDEEEWLAAFQDYVGDRFIIEPYEPEPVIKREWFAAGPLPSYLPEHLAEKKLFVNFAGHPYPAEMFLDEPASGMVKIGATIPIDESGIGDRLFSALKKYSVPASTENGDNNVD